ncbi:MAG: hypothetical protein N3G20_02930, partial [Verrucomicrobiae bacterium]|nr:hypothetical protein [Verrucomicrobiae bacterium]
MKMTPRSVLVLLLLGLGTLARRADGYSQDFNTWPFTGLGGPPFYLPLFVTSSNQGWVAQDTSVAADGDDQPGWNYIPAAYSLPRAAWLKDLATGGNPWV